MAKNEENHYQWIQSDDPTIEVGSYVSTQIDTWDGKYPVVEGYVVETRDNPSFPWITSALVELE